MGCTPSIHNIKNFKITLNNVQLTNDIIYSGGYYFYFIKDIKKYDDWSIYNTRSFMIHYRENRIHLGMVISDMCTGESLIGKICYTYINPNIPINDINVIPNEIPYAIPYAILINNCSVCNKNLSTIHDDAIYYDCRIQPMKFKNDKNICFDCAFNTYYICQEDEDYEENCEWCFTQIWRNCTCGKCTECYSNHYNECEICNQNKNMYYEYKNFIPKKYIVCDKYKNLLHLVFLNNKCTNYSKIYIEN